MKSVRFFLTIFLCGFSLQSAAGATTLSSFLLSRSFLTSSVFSSLSAQRCWSVVRQLDLHQTPDSAKSCLSLMKDFGNFLDLAVVRRENGQSYPVVFHQRLIEIIRDERFPFLTEQLKQQLETVLSYDQPFALFEIMKNFTSDRGEALEWTAVLFQDVTPLRLHLRWAAQNVQDAQTLARIEKFAHVLDELWRISRLDAARSDRLDLYPPEVKLGAARNAKIYHFYVPALLAQKTRAAGYSKELSIYLAYHFNFLYEAFGQSNGRSLAWKDPESLRHPESAKDSYLGLRGSFYTLNPMLSPISPEEFMEKIKRDVPGSHHTLLATLGWYFRWSKDF